MPEESFARVLILRSMRISSLSHTKYEQLICLAFYPTNMKTIDCEHSFSQLKHNPLLRFMSTLSKSQVCQSCTMFPNIFLETGGVERESSAKNTLIRLFFNSNDHFCENPRVYKPSQARIRMNIDIVISARCRSKQADIIEPPTTHRVKINLKKQNRKTKRRKPNF